MDWALIYRDDSNRDREVRLPQKSCKQAMLQANSLRTRFAIIRIEGPGVKFDAAAIVKELASGKYTPQGMAIPEL
jgi:hypothetical protein